MSAINIKTLDHQTILEFLNSFDTILTDCDGVLWRYMTPLQNASNVINLFRQLGKRIFYITNNSTKTSNEYVDKCRSLGFEANRDDILCTANLTASYLKDIGFSKKAYIIGPEAIASELKQVGISYCGVGPDIAEQDISYFEKDFEKDPEIGAVIVGFDEHFSYPKMVKASIYLRDTNVHFIGTNLDERLPLSKNVIIPGTGSLIKAIESCSERKAIIMGKPEHYLMKMLVTRSGFQPKRMLMIGDRCSTDILFGVRNGCETLLVLTGINTLSDIEKWKQSERQEEKCLVPNYYIDALGDLLPYLEELKTEMNLEFCN